MTSTPLRAAMLAALAAGGLLAGCGGDGGTPAAPPTAAAAEMPAAAAATDASLEAFAIGQAPSETAEPLRITSARANSMLRRDSSI